MLPQRLKQLRADKGVSQTQLAGEMGVTQGTVGNWETGKRVPDIKMLNKLADYFGVAIDCLLREVQTPELLLLARFSGLSENEKMALIEKFNGTFDTYMEKKAAKGRK